MREAGPALATCHSVIYRLSAKTLADSSGVAHVRTLLKAASPGKMMLSICASPLVSAAPTRSNHRK